MANFDMLTPVLFRNKDISNQVDEWMGGTIQVSNTAVTREEIRTRLHPDCRAKIQPGTTVLYLIKSFEHDDENRLIPVQDASHIVEMTAENIVRKRITNKTLLARVMPELLVGVSGDLENEDENRSAAAGAATVSHITNKEMDRLIDLTFKLRNTPALKWMVDHQGFVLKLENYFSDRAWAAHGERYGKAVVMGEQVSMLSQEDYFKTDGLVMVERQAGEIRTMVDYLFSKCGHKAVIDYKDNLKRTPEHVACLRGDAALLHYILYTTTPHLAGRNVKVLPVDKFGETPLHHLSRKGHGHLAHLYKTWSCDQQAGDVRLIPVEDLKLLNHKGQTFLDMCVNQNDPSRTLTRLVDLQDTLIKLDVTVYDGTEEDDTDDAMTPEELAEWAKAKEADFLNVCFADPVSDHTLELDKILKHVDDELKKIMRIRLRPTLEELQETYYVLGKCFHTQPKLALHPPNVSFSPRPAEKMEAIARDIAKDYYENGELGFSYDFDFTSVDMYGYGKCSLIQALMRFDQDISRVEWILEKVRGDASVADDANAGLWNEVFREACLLGYDEMVDHVLRKYETEVGAPVPWFFLECAVGAYNDVAVESLVSFHDVKVNREHLRECVCSVAFDVLWKLEPGLPTDTAYYNQKMEWKSLCRLPILKKLIGEYRYPESEVDWQSMLEYACEDLMGTGMKSVVPFPRELMEWLLTKEGTNLLEITDGKTADMLAGAPKWFTGTILPAEEEKRRRKQQQRIAQYVQPLIRGKLARNLVLRTYPDFGSWSRVIFELNRRLEGSAPQRVKFQSWVQLKLDNPIVFQSEEFKILEEAALATQGYEDDFNEEDYEKNATQAFPGVKPSDSEGHVCKILFTSGILNWRRKVKDQKYLRMFRDRIDSLARGAESYCMSKRLKGSKHSALETKLDKGMRIIWTQRGTERMIWFVCKHDHISKCVELIDKSYDRVVKSRVNYGLEEWEEMGDTDTDTAEPDMLASPEQNTPLKIHAVSVESLATSWNDIDWRPPLKLTAKEEKIVNMPGTVLLLGRSGTGKTLCVCNRMARDRKQYGYDIRQLFVARTRRLCEYVKDLQQREQFGTDMLEHARFQTMEELAQELFEELDQETSQVWRKGKYVDFKRFREEFAKGERVKQILPERKILLMWTQIRSFIKGSYEAVACGRPLEEAEYIDSHIIEKDRCRLKENERVDAYKVYSFYKAYLDESGLWDEMDRAAGVARLMRAKAERDIEEFGEPETRCQRVYVDEVQDITQAEMAILFYATGGKVNSMFFAGDNAQSVSEGVDFRFAEVRSLVHKITNKEGKIERPQRLERNFRSHERILRVSNFLLERMYVAFPNSVTKLKTDLGLVMGPRPGIIAQCSLDQLAEIISGNQRLRVLVRDEHRSVLEADLEERLGSDAASKVLGIREAKGLEFTEVLIVDFFATITEKAHHKAWKTIIEGNLEGKLDHIPATMELELKLLYTAITRCCDRLFFVETKRTMSFDKWKLHLTTVHPGSDADPLPDKLAQIMEPEQTKSERGIMTVDDYRVEGIENASFVAGEDMDYEDAVKYLERSVGSFEKAGDKYLEEKARMHLDALHKKEELKSSGDSGFGEVFLSFVDAGLAQEARDYCKDYASGGLKHHFQRQLDALISKKASAPVASPTGGLLRRSSTMESSHSGMRRLSSSDLL